MKSTTRLVSASLHLKRLRSVLLAVTLTATLSAQTAPASAPAKDDTIVLSAVSVTGSNIKRLDQEKVLPVTVIGSEQIASRDSTTPMDLLAGIPQVTNIPNNETSVNAVAARGDNANVALRGLGAANTLVILNGRRMPFHPFNTSSVNVNTLPTFGIDQIEVLRDGASAIYGSDAVAGVINYVTQKKPNGGEISVRYGATAHGGGMEGTLNLGLGTTFAQGKGTWITSFTAYYRDAIYWREREFSKSANKLAYARAPWNIDGSSYDTRTATTTWPSFRLGAGITTGGTVNWFYPATTGATPTLTTTALPRSLYGDYNLYTTGQPLSARGNLFNRFEYDLTDKIKAFGELSGYISKSQTGRQPVTLSASDAAVTLGIDNPFNPYGSRFNSATGAPNSDGTARVTRAPTALTLATMTLDDGGPEKIEATDQVYRILTGLTGTIGTSTWNWETALMIGGVRATDYSINAIRESKLKAAALRTDVSAWNPFGYTFKVVNGAVVADSPYTNPQSVRDAYTQSANRYGHSKLASFDARIGGEVYELWAGPIAASVGGEWRREFKEDHRDPFVGLNPASSGLDPTNNDILVTSPKADYGASRIIASGFAETVVPLASPKNNLLLLRSLELNASVRYEHYSDFGGTTKPKFGLTWKPITSLLVRASVNKGFRAPDLVDLYQPASFTVGSPPGNRDTVRNNFLTSAGLPSDIQVLNKTYSLGNPDLGPEESTGRSVGLALDIPKIKGLSITIDYWEIKQSNLIVSKTRDTAVDEQLIRAYTQKQLAAGKTLAQIDTGSRITPDGANTYVGDPFTLRNPVTDADRALFAQANALLPASQQMATLGTWIGTTTQLINSTGTNFTNGIDYSLNYNLPRTPLGQFLFSIEWSQFLNKYTKTTPTSPKDDDINAMVLPRSKASLNLQWRKAAWSASTNVTFNSDVRTGATANLTQYTNLGAPSYIKPVFNNGATTYYEKGEYQYQINVGLGYRFGATARPWLKHTDLRFGINNLLDESPNRVATAAGYTGGLGTTLWIGRAYSLTASRKF